MSNSAPCCDYNREADIGYFTFIVHLSTSTPSSPILISQIACEILNMALAMCLIGLVMAALSVACKPWGVRTVRTVRTVRSVRSVRSVRTVKSVRSVISVCQQLDTSSTNCLVSNPATNWVSNCALPGTSVSSNKPDSWICLFVGVLHPCNILATLSC